MTILEVTDLHHRFGPHRVLRGVDLSLNRSECVVLFGDNGSGKSTLLRLLSTRLAIQKGDYHLNGLTVAKDGEEMRGRLLFLGHDSHLYGHLTSLENLLFFAELRGLRPSGDQLRQAVDQVGLSAFAHRPTRWFSAGMKKRLTLARLLIAKPDLLLLDEPYSALDAQGVDWLNALLIDFRNQGGMVILASHDPGRVAILNPRPLHLIQGRLQSLEEDACPKGTPTMKEDVRC